MIQVFTIPKDKLVKFHVTGFNTRKTVLEVAEWWHSQAAPGNHTLVTNGDDYSLLTPWKSNSRWVSDGATKNGEWLGWHPVFCGDRDSKMFMWFRKWPLDKYYPEKHTVWNGFSLTRDIIKDGAINPAFKEDNAINNIIGYGLKDNGDIVMGWSDGWDWHHSQPYPQGVTKTEFANVMIANGVVYGGDGGYGGGLGVAIDGAMVNNWYNDGNPMHRNINHACFEFSELPGIPEPPPVEPPDEPTSTIPPIIQTHEKDGTVIARYERKVE